ncbi:MAG: FAD-dependent oxidoreductase [Fretibacterium sp.]|nr:FAD-dependent oxidoreductase [Fretibacterium sp.]
MTNTLLDAGAERGVDVLIVGGGPAGLAAAVKLWDMGVHSLLILEREKQLGGILRQCIHDGFGLTRFGTTLSGPEYAQHFIREVQEKGIPHLTNAAVVDISGDKLVTVATREGLRRWRAKAVVLAMGCRERTRGALAIPGERPAGVFTAGVAQAYMNLCNRMPAREVVILGSGDIGMIMARRLTLEGAHVQAVFEVLPYPSGLPRNIEQCLNDYNIPLYLSHTVTAIHGDARLTGVTVSEVDERMRPIPGTEKEYPCDTLILSVGLIPENELSLDSGVRLDGRTRGAEVDEFFQTSVPGIFSAGNVLHVHDLVDFVSLEAESLAESCARYIREGLPGCALAITADKSVNHTVPMRASGARDVHLSLRAARPFRDCRVVARQGGRELASKKMRKAIPAEMIHLDVPASQIAGQEDIVVSIEAREGV